jgi:hypothetical protein
MKKLLILLNIMILSHVSYAQDILDPQPFDINLMDTTSVIQSNSSNFVKGWNWGAYGGNTHESLLMNFNHEWCYNWALDRVGDNQLMLAAMGIATGKNSTSIAQVQSILYEPSIEVFQNDNSFSPSTNDSSGAIFGFKSKHSNYLASQTTFPDTNAKYFVLKQSNLSANSPDTVLQNCWLTDQFFWEPNLNTTNLFPSDSLLQTMNGSKWTLSVNIKRIGNISGSLDDTVLTIKAPFYLTGSTNKNYIQFRRLPLDGFGNAALQNIIGDRGDFRGQRWVLDSNTTTSTELVILKKHMMLDSTNMIDSSITLFAEFYCDNNIIINNPNIRLYSWDDRIDRISDIGVEVIYHGNADIAIDWVKIETLHAQEVHDGIYDEEIREGVQNAINAVEDEGRGIGIYRFYCLDEAALSQIYVLRYFNKLLQGLVTTETGVVFSDDRNALTFPKMYEHLTEIDMKWTGDSYSISTHLPVPYYTTP